MKTFSQDSPSRLAANATEERAPMPTGDPAPRAASRIFVLVVIATVLAAIFAGYGIALIVGSAR